MSTRIAHISDLHLPARDSEQAAALARSIHEIAPDMLVLTGDLTRRGRRQEYRIAAEFLAGFEMPKLIVPGNHDVPLFANRLSRPFARFAETFPQLPPYLETSDAFVVGLNTAVGARLSNWDWSLGDAPADRIGPVAMLLREKRDGRLGIVACHHPLRPHPLDVRRSTTAKGPQAFEDLASAGMQLLLHGHLHRTSRACTTVNGAEICELCANTALSDREREGAAGYNVLDIESGAWELHAMRWQDGRYSLAEAVTGL